MVYKYLLLDMDGVVCDFVKGVCKLFDLNYDEFYNTYRPATFNLQDTEYLSQRGITNKKMFDKVASAGIDFWANLEEYPGASMFYKSLCNAIGKENIIFSTQPSSDSSCAAGKIEWLKRFTGDKKFSNYMVGKHKFLMASDKTLLVDDKQENIQMFKDSGGGAFLFPRPWNPLSKESYLISSDYGAYDLCFWFVCSRFGLTKEVVYV